MFKAWEQFKDFMGLLLASKPKRRQRDRPQIEGLEERWCPAGTWQWNGLNANNTNWSNSANWAGSK